MDHPDDEPPFGGDESSRRDSLDLAINELELAMIKKPRVPTFEMKDEYVAGYIEAMFVHGRITELERDLLNMQYSERLI